MLLEKLVHFALKFMPIIMLVLVNYVHVSKKYRKYEFGENTSITMQVTSKW